MKKYIVLTVFALSASLSASEPSLKVKLNNELNVTMGYNQPLSKSTMTAICLEKENARTLIKDILSKQARDGAHRVPFSLSGKEAEDYFAEIANAYANAKPTCYAGAKMVGKPCYEECVVESTFPQTNLKK